MNLEEAIKAGDLNQARILIREDAARASHPTSMGVSPLLLALYYQQRPIAEFISTTREVDLFEAAALGDDDAVRGLANSGNVNSFSPDCFNALGYAAYFGNIEACKALVESGAKPNIKSNNGLGVLPHHSALSNNNPAIAKLLIEAGGDPNEASKEGWTALHYVAHSGDSEMTLWLLARGAKPASNAAGKSPADLATEAGFPDLAKLLAEE